MATDLTFQLELLFALSQATRRLLPVLRLPAIAQFTEATTLLLAELMSHELTRL